MRITVSHNKTKEEVIKAVDQASDQVLTPVIPGPVRMTDVHKNWNGPQMNFSLTAKMGIMSTPIKGSVLVTDRDVTIECDLPSFLSRLLPESTIRTGIESKVRGLLNA